MKFQNNMYQERRKFSKQFLPIRKSSVPFNYYVMTADVDHVRSKMAFSITPYDE